VLVKPLWFVVSNDKPVLAKAAVLGVAALSREEFLAAADHEWAA
jgi:hypothetical protein